MTYNQSLELNPVEGLCLFLHDQKIANHPITIFCLYAATEGNHIKVFMRGRPITMFIPSDVENYEDVRTELPAERLKLEWVYPSPEEVASKINTFFLNLDSKMNVTVCQTLIKTLQILQTADISFPKFSSAQTIISHLHVSAW